MKRERLRLGHDFEIKSLPIEFFELGKRRTAPMMAYQAERLSLADLVANAYLQGIQDATEVLAARD